MRCPFCGKEMEQGTIKADARSLPKWAGSKERPGLFGTGRVIKSFRRSYPLIESPGFLCSACGKLILDVKF